MIKSVELGEMRENDEAIVHQVMGNVRDVSRLCELGMCSGSQIQIVRKGAPCIVQVGETRLCLRLNRDLRVLVCPL